jgi:phosphatidylserine/phosphatidylglycerophosphate/cardiolipin synthase-like enzyme
MNTNKIGALAAVKAGNPVNLPPVPQTGTTIQPLMSPDDIYSAELAVINETHPGQDLYIAQYSLPSLKDTPDTSIGTPASNAQREILNAILSQIKYNNVHVYIIADNSSPSDPNQKNGKAHNEDTIQFLHEQGAYILPYPKQWVHINHTKFIANNDYAVITSANMSAHQADSPDDNTGFLFAGAAAHNGIVHSFLPQWNFAVSQDNTGWASNYPTPNINPVMLPDDKITWLNTAPGAETNAKTDTTEIKEAYLKLIEKAASGPANAYLYLEQFDLSEMDLVHALIKAKQENPSLDIRIISDPNMLLQGEANQQTTGHDGRVEAYKALTQAGIPVKFAPVNPTPPGPEGSFPQIFHDKSMVYNDEEVINGSANFSFSGLDGNNPALTQADLPKVEDPNSKMHLHNREVDVDVVDSTSAQAYKQKFLRDWGVALDDPKEASQAGGTSPQTPPQNPTQTPEGNGNPDFGFGGYLDRLSSYSQTITSLFHLEPANPASTFPNALPALNWGLGTVSFMNPLGNWLLPQMNLIQAPPMPWVVPSGVILSGKFSLS